MNSNETKTGTELYNDIISRRQKYSNQEFECECITVNNKSEYKNLINKIKNEYKNGIYPILHFEIHGLSDKSGLQLNNGDTISYFELTADLSDINLISKNNLFLTLAVCHGAYLLSAIKIYKPAPYLSFVGSFDSIGNNDILNRYSEFYGEFLSSFNLYTSLKYFFDANQIEENKFSFIDSEETFRKVYKNYLIENTSKEGIKKRIEKYIIDKKLKFASRQLKRKFGRDFSKKIKKTKQEYYSKHKKIFFMIDHYPENETRFNLPTKYYGILD